MQAPRLHSADTSIKRRLALTPSAVGAFTMPEDEITVAASGLTIEDSPRLHRQGKGVLPTVLGPGRGQHNRALVNLTPPQSPYLFSPLAGQDQQSDDVAELVLSTGTPDRDKLGLGEDAVTRRSLLCLGGPCDRVDLNEAILDCPGEERGQAGPNSIPRYSAAGLLDLIEPHSYGPLVDLSKPLAMQRLAVHL